MNTLQVILGNNTNNLFEHSLKMLKGKFFDVTKQNIIIVPDKLSLITEQKIFEILNIDVYFNIAVMGISQFTSKIIKENYLNLQSCTALESKLLTLKAIQNVCENFKCFSKKYTLGFVDEIYAKIEQIKSSDVSICNLIDDKASIGTKLKFEDLTLIYNEYEKLRGEKIDSGAMLTLFNQVCGESEFIKNCNVYFIGFDSLTKQGLQTLKNVIKNANYTQISVVAPRNQNNTKLYDTTFLDGVINICKQEKFECNIEYITTKFNNNSKQLILENLFSNNKINKNKTDYFNIVKCNTFIEEIDICVKQINYLLKNQSLKFKDIYICCDSSYHEILKTKLNGLNIDVYCDLKTPLINLEPINLILLIFKYNINKKTVNLLQIIDNDFIEINNDNKNQIKKLLLQFGDFYTIKKYAEIDDELLIIIDALIGLIENINLNDSVVNYIEIINKLVKKLKIKEKLLKKCEFFAKKGEINLQKTYSQFEEHLDKVLKSLTDTLGQNNVELNEFCEMLENVFLTDEISCVPSSTNELFIGDLKSFYNNPKYLFILGMNEGVMPAVLNDFGLISDKEICSQTIQAKLEPTTKIINKRNKFKLFEIILSAQNKCYFSYHAFDNENKKVQTCDFIEELCSLFDVNITTSNQLKFLDYSASLDKICFNAIDNYNANLLLGLNINNKCKAIVKKSLNDLQKLHVKKLPDNYNVDFERLYFASGKASVSLVEKYNMCPKSAFLANGLKLKKTKNAKFEANIVGTFIHEVGQKFVNINKNKLGTLSEHSIKICVEKILDEILKKQEYVSINLKDNNYLLFLLKNESLKFCMFINLEQSVSEFKTKYTEKYFGENAEFKSIDVKIDEKIYKISGIVDRIDVFDDNFRIIDYKTGKTTNSSGASKLYFGTKIQLFVYAKAIQQNLNKNLYGAFYLPINNSLSTSDSDYSFSGFFLNDYYFAQKCDKNFGVNNPNSSLLNVSLSKPKKDGELKLKSKQNILTKEQLQSYCDYSIAMVKNAIKEMCLGYICSSPLKNSCDYCEFKNICKFKSDSNVIRQPELKIDNNTFVEVDYE